MSKTIRYGLADTDLGRIHPQADGHLVMWADYAALAAENERLRKAGEWQPIETSPDGNALILIMHKDKEVEIIYASDLCHYCNWMTGVNTYPTHWMPLPAAPAAKEGGSK